MANITSNSAVYKAAREKLGDHRKDFDSLTDALATLRAIYAIDGFPQEFPTVAARLGLVDVSGEDTIPPVSEWPVEFSAPGVSVVVTFIGVRGIKVSSDPNDKPVNGARGFAIFPLHPVEAITADDSGNDWLKKVITKESAHVALRGLRNVNPALGTDALVAAAQSMPLSVSDYVEESTSEGLDTAAFDKLWKQFRKLLSEDPATAALAVELPNKAEVIKAIRSAAFAREEYGNIESMGGFKWIGETMAATVDGMKAAASQEGEDFDFDSAEIRGWLAGRDSKVFTTPKRAAADLNTVDFAAFSFGKKAE